MQLKDRYYKVVGKEIHDKTYRYAVELIAEHAVYKGHFPGNPVSPGVFSIQMLRECCEDAIQKELKIESIGQCRFITVLCPNDTGVIDVAFSIDEKLDGEYRIIGEIKGNELTYVTIKETLRRK